LGLERALEAKFQNPGKVSFWPESTVRYLGIEVEDALEMAERTDV
jgi:hypothetical protein